MSPSLDKVERAFHAALAARESGQSIDLGLLCDGDSSVADEVRNLLKHLDDAGTDERAFLSPSELHAERQPSRIDGDESDHENEWGISAVGQRVGEFTIIGELGAGGMGVVFVAAQDNPQRTVALKLIRRAIATKTMVRRFEREAQLLGRLNHPGIAQVYAAGVADITDAQGVQVRAPFIAMELVEGPTILEYVRKHRAQGPQLAIRLIAQVCDAIDHAHLRGVIHRDLKPANILIADTQGQPQVKVLDFGVARQAEDEPSGAGSPHSGVAEATTRLTFHGHLVGTLAYMPPEQFNTMGEADVRSDVYALGAILHQLLSGQHPIDVSECTLLEAARRITEVEPKWLGTIDSSLRGDVETIVAKTLEKQPSRRYQSPAELARDLRHHLAGEPIEARRDSVMYVLRKQAAQYRAIAMAAMLFLLIAIAVVFYAQYQEHQQQRVAEVATAAQAEAEAARRRADETAVNLAEELSASRLAEGRLLADSGDLAGAERLLWDELIYQKDKNRPRWAVWELYVKSGCANTILAHAGECQDVALAPDGKSFATCGEDRFVRIWRLPDGAKLAEHASGVSNGRSIAFTRGGSEVIVTGPEGAMLIDVQTGARRALPAAKDSYGIDVSIDGAIIAIGNNDGSVRLFDRTSLNEILVIQRDEVVSARRRGARGVAFNAMTTQLAAAYDDGDVRIFNVTINGSGHPTYTPGPEVGGHPTGGAQCVRFSPDGATLVSGGTDRNIRLSRASDGATIASIPTSNGTARAIAFSADGSFFVVPGYWKTRFYDARTGEPIAPPGNRAALGAGGSYGACFTPDGHHLLTAQEDGSCRIWRLTGRPFVALPSTRATVRDLAVAHVGDDCVIATAQTDGTVRVRAAPIGSPLRSEWRDLMQCDAGEALRCMTMTTDASRLFVGRADGRVLVLDARDGKVIQEIEAHGGTVNMCRLTPDGSLLITSSTDRTAKVWRRAPIGETWELASTLDCEGDVIGIAVHPTGRALVTTNRPAHIRFLSLRADGSTELLHQVSTEYSMWKPAFHRTGDWLAVGAWDRSIMMWNTKGLGDATGSTTPPPRHELSLMGHSQLPVAGAFEDSNRLFASVSNDGTLRVWDILRRIDSDDATDGASEGPRIDRRRGLATLDAKAGDAICVAFLPTAPRSTMPTRATLGPSIVAVGYADGSVRLWSLQYFHEAVMHNDTYQRKLRNIGAFADTPATTPATTRATP